MSAEHEREEDNSKNNILRMKVFEATGTNGEGCLIYMSALLPAYIVSAVLIIEGLSEGKLDKAALGAIAFTTTYKASRRVDAAQQRIVELEASSNNSSNTTL
jgi:hypothetical protein